MWISNPVAIYMHCFMNNRSQIFYSIIIYMIVEVIIRPEGGRWCERGSERPHAGVWECL